MGIEHGALFRQDFRSLDQVCVTGSESFDKAATLSVTQTDKNKEYDGNKWGKKNEYKMKDYYADCSHKIEKTLSIKTIQTIFKII